MSEPFVNLDAIFNLAVKDSEELIKFGLHLSESCVVTSVRCYVNKYQEIAERCNNALLKLIDK